MHIKSKNTNCRKRCMQEKRSIMVVRGELKIPSLGITVQHNSARLVMPNSYHCGGIFNPYLKQCDQGLHCLPFCLYLLDAYLHGKTTLCKF